MYVHMYLFTLVVAPTKSLIAAGTPDLDCLSDYQVTGMETMVKIYLSEHGTRAPFVSFTPFPSVQS